MWLTAYQLLHLVGQVFIHSTSVVPGASCRQVRSGDRVLIHAGASGVGTAAIQLCLAVGAQPLVSGLAVLVAMWSSGHCRLCHQGCRLLSHGSKGVQLPRGVSPACTSPGLGNGSRARSEEAYWPRPRARLVVIVTYSRQDTFAYCCRVSTLFLIVWVHPIMRRTWCGLTAL